VELSRVRYALSDLIGLRVYDGRGSMLGRVFEVRGHRERDGRLVIEELLAGRKGLGANCAGPVPTRAGYRGRA
jgi:ribosomal 30S subunit maturation factor RimM